MNAVRVLIVDPAMALRPHVVVMDLHMPGMSGTEATREINAALPGTAILVLTMYEDDASVFAALGPEHVATCSKEPTRQRSCELYTRSPTVTLCSARTWRSA